MSMMKNQRVLWRRHWWEACLLVVVSLTLSVLVWGGAGERFWKGLVWLEVASLVWLVTRVALTQSGFGTFGGWRSRPGGRLGFVMAEVVFLMMPLLLVGGVRVGCAIEILHPQGTGWWFLLESWAWSFFWVVALYVACRVVALGWEWGDGRARPKLAWTVVLVLIVGSLLVHERWGRVGERARQKSGNSTRNLVRLDPRGNPEVKEWQLLRDRNSYHEPAFNAFAVDCVKVPLKKDEAGEGYGLRVLVKGVEKRESGMLLTLEVTRVGELSESPSNRIGFLVSFKNGYFGDRWQMTHETRDVRVPLLGVDRMIYRGLYFSPHILPENEETWEELVEGAEVWVGTNIEASMSVENVSGGKDDSGMNHWHDKLDLSGRESLSKLLEAAPHSNHRWSDVAIPYWEKVANEGDREQLLGRLELDPRMGGLFLRKGWADDAEPILRRHLEKGKSLTKATVIFLTKLGEEEMGPRLENQLLRMEGDITRVVEVVKEHPGVDWERVRREAWRRVVTGFGNHHVWVKWGAEMGEKEALKRLLEKAAEGKKWERGVLEEWFGEEDVVNRLRGNWERVVFEDGEWMVGE